MKAKREMRTYLFKIMSLTAFLALWMAVLPSLALAASGTPTVKQKVELLFVQNSRGVAIDKGALTLKEVSPTTLWFSDRPVRMAGHFNMKEYLATWGEGAESFLGWAEDIRRGRCGSGSISRKPGSCGDIEFYLVQVKFNALDDEAERSFLKRIPASFVLKPEQVDTLRDAARRILEKSREFQRLVKDLQ